MFPVKCITYKLSRAFVLVILSLLIVHYFGDNIICDNTLSKKKKKMTTTFTWSRYYHRIYSVV